MLLKAALGFSLIALVGCQNKPVTDLKTVTTYRQTFDYLRNISCGENSEAFDLSPLKIKADPVLLGEAYDVEKALPENVKFTGGWHLTAKDQDFGGLSGLDLLPNGDLLTVSDKGLFFQVGMTDQAPDGRGSILPMRSAKGKSLVDKKSGDAEGLSLKAGIAFVSFERDHRILAFDLKGCGAAAKGALFTPLPKTIYDQNITSNGGAEALHFGSDKSLHVGYETTNENIASIFTVQPNGTVEGPTDTLRLMPGFKITGMSDKAVLTRAYDRENGNRNEIRLQQSPNIQGSLNLTLTPPLAMDNFEGIVDYIAKDGRHIIYIISDDNFSERQRTLLYRFDLLPS